MWNVQIAEDSWELQIPETLEQFLREQTIDGDGPGTILRDFETLLDFIGERGLKTTGKYHFLPQSKLDELNARMTRPMLHRLKRPQQRSFPTLHGLYLVLRATGLGVGVGSPPSGRLMIDPEMLAAWRELNPTEQYFTLLESWMVRGSPEIIAERGGWGSDGFQVLTWVYQKLSNVITVVDERHRGGLFYGTMQLVTVALMDLFGWARVEYGQPADGEGAKPAEVERLALGDAISNLLFGCSLTNDWPGFDERPPKPGALQSLFQPYFPEWQRNLELPEAEFRDGTYLWKVSLGRAWRRIVAPADLTLDSMVWKILDAFEFSDTEHLYCFELRDRQARKMRIACPYEEDAEAFTDEVSLGDLPLAEGGTMNFLFDYGDRWQFSIKLEQVTSADAKLTGAKVTAKQGEPQGERT